MRTLNLRNLCPGWFFCLTILGLSVDSSFGQSLRAESDIKTRTWTSAASMEQGNEKVGLELTLKTKNRSFKLGDTITIEALLTNRSKSSVYLYVPLEWGESASLSLWLKDHASGKDVSQEFIADAPAPPPPSKEAFIKLLPNHIYGVVLTCSLADLSIQKKGVYEVIAEYHSPIPSALSFGLAIWSKEMGSISSNRIEISVDN